VGWGTAGRQAGRQAVVLKDLLRDVLLLDAGDAWHRISTTRTFKETGSEHLRQQPSPIKALA
jgi:hypothetical protein